MQTDQVYSARRTPTPLNILRCLGLSPSYLSSSFLSMNSSCQTQLSALSVKAAGVTLKLLLAPQQRFSFQEIKQSAGIGSSARDHGLHELRFRSFSLFGAIFLIYGEIPLPFNIRSPSRAITKNMCVYYFLDIL